MRFTKRALFAYFLIAWMGIAPLVWAASSNPIHDPTTGIMHPASTISFSPTGDVTATNVQAAIAQVDADSAGTAEVTTIATNLATHTAETTLVHGITDTSLLTTKAYVDGTDETLAAALALTNGYLAVTTSEIVQIQADLVTHETELIRLEADKADASELALTNGYLATATSEIATIQADLLTHETELSRLEIDKADTSEVATVVSDLANHTAETTTVHGIADTSILTTKAYVDGTDEALIIDIAQLDTGKASTDSVTLVQSNLTAHEGDTVSAHIAAAIDPDTTNFNQNLSAADDTVQKALETLDELSVTSGVSSVSSASADLTSSPTTGAVILTLGANIPRLDAATNDFAGNAYFGPSNYIQLGTQDSSARYQIWNNNIGGTIRLGSNGSQGDATNITTTGILSFGQNVEVDVYATARYCMGVYAPNYIQFYNAGTQLNNNFYYMDKTNMYYRNNSDVITWQVTRATGAIQTAASLTLNYDGATTEDALLYVSSDAVKPALKWNGTTKAWQYSNDGTSFNNISSASSQTFLSGKGVFAGNGSFVTITHGDTLTDGSYEVFVTHAGIDTTANVGGVSVPENYQTVTTFRVYNTGASTSRFHYMLIDNN